MHFFLVFAAFAAEAFALRSSMLGAARVNSLPNVLKNVARDTGPVKGYPNIQQAEFQQPLDHNDPSKGTFAIRYWFDTTYWKGPGSPIVLTTYGETDATYYINGLTNRSMVGVTAKAIGAAAILVEHRYFGQSIPVDSLTTANMKYLTLEDSLKDLSYFARTVELPFARNAGCASNAADVPWVLMGGSYAGSLAAWTAKLFPDTFWAYYASSSVVHQTAAFWQFFEPVKQNMPQDCRDDVTAVIDHMDEILIHGSEQNIADLKARFDFPAKIDSVDFMYALARAPSLWFQRDIASEAKEGAPRAKFLVWCDYVENAVNKSSSSTAGPVGVEAALDGYAKWWHELGANEAKSETGCTPDTTNFDCFDTTETGPITDRSLSLADDISYSWMQCSWPDENFQVGAPPGIPSLLSRLITVEHRLTSFCAKYFPPGPNGETYGIAKGLTAEDVNAYTGGWDVSGTTRLIYVNGEYDMWRAGGVSSDQRPGGPLQDTPQIPVKVVPGGFHCSDLSTANGDASPRLRQVQNEVVAQLEEWVREWPERALPQ
ncbi:unnamed protein product [Zymoseptoria tritici ST99CH_1A5]|uniref:Serine carboxypeptidase S28 n=2 Tax=Zymoseptoria tritici TaxID=1047171 RepID=A0A1X7S2R9_ZYMT9|nr:unnamed protein product [Zymoseptoria tritici ST99CH_3D7]SMY27635.1 unnamed protein product [Zymoseptoria tritici ST99CH_1A5]